MFKSLLWLSEVTSTQAILKEGRLRPWTLVVSNKQTSGRGRLGRVWYSFEGGLYLSFSLSAGFKDERSSPLVVANAVADYLKSLGFMPAIKWVNDVYLQGKKVCGVLVEKLREQLIVGIGINLNQESFPQDLEAVSLKMILGKTFEKVDFLLGLMDHLQKNLERLMREGFSTFRKSIEDRLLFKGAEVILYTPEPVVGILEGLEEDGSLMLLTQEGLKSFQVGELTLRPL
ncbi:MAG: biotin--[acetyl-CoA-carboxylase] ligase [Aquificaceae bacterium]|nr:biotin--[acetyl-CoA-carboxylase] ligase [Aquificaceae bacterium]